MDTNVTFQWELLLPKLPWDLLEVNSIQDVVSSAFIYTTITLMIGIAIFVTLGTFRSLRWIELLTTLLEGMRVSDLAERHRS